MLLHAAASVITNVGRFGMLLEDAAPLLAHVFEMTATVEMMRYFPYETKVGVGLASD